jgi:hypothetical protein
MAALQLFCLVDEVPMAVSVAFVTPVSPPVPTIFAVTHGNAALLGGTATVILSFPLVVTVTVVAVPVVVLATLLPSRPVVTVPEIVTMPLSPLPVPGVAWRPTLASAVLLEGTHIHGLVRPQALLVRLLAQELLNPGQRTSHDYIRCDVEFPHRECHGGYVHP